MFGVWKEKSMFGKKYFGIERSSFLINPQGKIEKAYEKVNPLTHLGEVLKDIASVV
jgi:peroxiredoxin Q/BCP